MGTKLEGQCIGPNDLLTSSLGHPASKAVPTKELGSTDSFVRAVPRSAGAFDHGDRDQEIKSKQKDTPRGFPAISHQTRRAEFTPITRPMSQFETSSLSKVSPPNLSHYLVDTDRGTALLKATAVGGARTPLAAERGGMTTKRCYGSGTRVAGRQRAVWGQRAGDVTLNTRTAEPSYTVSAGSP